MRPATCCSVYAFWNICQINVGYPYFVIVVVIHTAHSWTFVLRIELPEDELF